MCDDNGNNFIVTLHTILLEPDLCNSLFSIITLINSGHPCLFQKGLCVVYYGDKEKNAVTLPHSAQSKHAFLRTIKHMSKSKKIEPRKKVDLGLLNYRLGHRYTRSLMAGDTVNIWEDTELMIDPYPFCTPCQISSMNKNSRSKNPLRRKAPF